MPLFDLNPKDTPRALFGRVPELDQMSRLIREGRWVAVLGPRMVGKTSLVKAVLREVDRPAIYVNLWGARGTLGFLNAFVHGLNTSRSLLSRVRSSLRRIEGVTLGPGGISITAPNRPLRTVWDLMDTIGAAGGRSVIALDEVQEISASSGTLLKLLANVFNSHPEVVFVLTGSRFGLLRTLLEPRAESPLFGRAPATVRLGPFDPAASVGFLEAGLREYRRELPRTTLAEVVDRSLDGLPGWLALFGNHVAVGRMDPADAEAHTVAEGRKVAGIELDHFLEGRSRELHLAALRAMLAPVTWTDLREYLSLRRGTRVNDNTIRNLLAALRDAELIVQEDERYRVADPMMRAYLRGSGRRRGIASSVPRAG
ncbi:MAG: AAA family ATPase [Thermoplasmata archaeon]